MYFFYDKPQLREKVVNALPEDAYTYMTAYNDGQCSLANITTPNETKSTHYDDSGEIPLTFVTIGGALLGVNKELGWAELKENIPNGVSVYTVCDNDSQLLPLMGVKAKDASQFIRTLWKVLAITPEYQKYWKNRFQHWRRKGGFVSRDKFMKDIPCQFTSTTWFDSNRGYV